MGFKGLFIAWTCFPDADITSFVEPNLFQALLLEKPFYPIKMVELMDCLLDAQMVSRLSRAFAVSEFLTKLNLDYNEFGDEGCKNLCKGLENNRTLLSLSMCYCDLGVASGTTLGHILTTTAVRLVIYTLSRDARKPVFGISDQVRHKPGCTVLEAG